MTSSLEHYLSLKYPIELEPDEEGFFATHPDLDGCAAQGKTPDEAVANLDDARRLWISARLKDGLLVPEPEARDYSGRILLRMATHLHESLARLAKRRGVSLNLLLNEILSEYVGGATLVERLESISTIRSQLVHQLQRVTPLLGSQDVAWSLLRANLGWVIATTARQSPGPVTGHIPQIPAETDSKQIPA